MNEQEMLDFIMPFGVHRKKKLRDVPIGYLLWLANENTTEGTLREILDHWEEEIGNAEDWPNDTTLGEVVD